MTLFRFMHGQKRGNARRRTNVEKAWVAFARQERLIHTTLGKAGTKLVQTIALMTVCCHCVNLPSFTR